MFGKAHDLAQFPDSSPILKGVVGRKQGDIRKALEHVRHNIVTVCPGEIDVEIGWVGPVQVEKALEVKVKLDGIDVCDAQQISHEAVRPTAPPYVEIALASCVTGDVPIDQEIGQITLLPDQRNLVFHPVQHLLVVVGIAVGQAFCAQ